MTATEPRPEPPAAGVWLFVGAALASVSLPLPATRRDLRPRRAVYATAKR